MKKTNKKGFTIVELVVVIVVIAILAAVLIPTFMGLIEKAKLSSDTQMIHSVNLALAINEAENGKCANMTDALKVAESVGYLLENITPASESYILYDSIDDRFALISLDGDEFLAGETSTKMVYESEIDKVVFWRIAADAAAADALMTTPKYSVYLALNDSFNSKVFDITVGLDVGRNMTTGNINYTGNHGNTSVIIRTNNAHKDTVTLTVNSPDGTVRHFGNVYQLTVTAIAANSYHEYGYVGNLTSVASGHFVAEKTACFHQNRDNVTSATSSATYTEQNGALYGVHKYEFDESVGKYKCIVCDAEYTGDTPPVDPTECHHTWEAATAVQTADCTHQGIGTKECTLCGATTVETSPALGHSAKSEWVKTNTEKHWHECKRSGCSAHIDEAEHTLGADSACTVCGYQANTECEHTNTKEKVLLEPSCYQTGVSVTLCSDCDAFINSIQLPKKHDYTIYWNGCDGSSNCDWKPARLVKICNVCEHYEAGKPNDICDKCKNGSHEYTVHEKKEKCPEGMHYLVSCSKSWYFDENQNWKNAPDDNHGMSCDYCARGYYEPCTPDANRTCSVCNETLSHEHTVAEDGWTVDEQPTCVKEGKRHGTCSVEGCNVTVKESIPATGHEVSGHTAPTLLTHSGTCSHTGCTSGHFNHTFEKSNTENVYFVCACGVKVQVLDYAEKKLTPDDIYQLVYHEGYTSTAWDKTEGDYQTYEYVINSSHSGNYTGVKIKIYVPKNP